MRHNERLRKTEPHGNVNPGKTQPRCESFFATVFHVFLRSRIVAYIYYTVFIRTLFVFYPVVSKNYGEKQSLLKCIVCTGKI
jgi:hypothetical protein